MPSSISLTPMLNRITEVFGNPATLMHSPVETLYEVPMSLFEENAAILRRMEADGSDLGPPRIIDFSHVFPDKASADAFAREVEREGYATALEEVEREEYPWDVTASKQMAPTCGNITDTEEHLDALARSYQGRTDGWGFFRL
jgi:hypothetical protein